MGGGIIFALFFPLILFVLIPLVGVFISSLLVFISNLNAGKKIKWAKKSNIVGATISGVLMTLSLVAFIVIVVYLANYFSSSNNVNSSSSMVSEAIQYLSLIHY